MMHDANTPLRRRNASDFSAGNVPDRISCLVCRAGGMLCALPIEQVIEIMRPLPVDRIAGAPNYVQGLSIIRGMPVPVADLGLIVAGRSTATARLVALKAGPRTVALAVDAVCAIAALAGDAFDRMAPLLRDAATETIDAIGALDAELSGLRTGRASFPKRFF